MGGGIQEKIKVGKCLKWHRIIKWTSTHYNESYPRHERVKWGSEEICDVMYKILTTCLQLLIHIPFGVHKHLHHLRSTLGTTENTT